jgi:hypothetical protein
MIMVGRGNEPEVFNGTAVLAPKLLLLLCLPLLPLPLVWLPWLLLEVAPATVVPEGVRLLLLLVVVLLSWRWDPTFVDPLVWLAAKPDIAALTLRKLWTFWMTLVGRWE